MEIDQTLHSSVLVHVSKTPLNALGIVGYVLEISQYWKRWRALALRSRVRAQERCCRDRGRVTCPQLIQLIHCAAAHI